MANLGNNANLLTRLQPLDRVVFGITLVMLVLIGILLIVSDRTVPQVQDFSWKNKQVGVGDKAFTLTFNRPLQPETIQKKNLTIRPSLPGKISWVGRKMTYTVTELPVYDTTYNLTLEGGKDRYNNKNNQIETFTSKFQTRDRIIAYIGVEGKEKGRLILYNLETKTKNSLTEQDLVVTDFIPYPDGDRLLFSAFKTSDQGEDFAEQQLYTVTTGLNFTSAKAPKPSGKINSVLNAGDYQNLQFALSSDSKNIVVQRIKKSNPAEFGLWLVPEEGEAQPLGIQGGQFTITPDGETIAVAQTNGVEIIPLTPKAETETFLEGYAQILGFSRNGIKIMVKFNDNYTRSVFLMTEEGQEQELFKTSGSILDCQFEPRKEETLYCLISQPTEGAVGEQLILTAVKLKTSEILPVITLPNQRAAQMSISPDGTRLVFEQLIAPVPGSQNNLRSNDGQTISTGSLWILSLPKFPSADNLAKVKPQRLISGFKPLWLP